MHTTVSVIPSSTPPDAVTQLDRASRCNQGTRHCIKLHLRPPIGSHRATSQPAFSYTSIGLPLKRQLQTALAFMLTPQTTRPYLPNL